uniref:Uncharacterized protein n=1 Tax=Anguilla anguilla TaxID=7936 RepID=A0A0E9XKN4_ANGAN
MFYVLSSTEPDICLGWSFGRSVAQWVRNWACNRKVVGSIPG